MKKIFGKFQNSDFIMELNMDNLKTSINNWMQIKERKNEYMKNVLINLEETGRTGDPDYEMIMKKYDVDELKYRKEFVKSLKNYIKSTEIYKNFKSFPGLIMVNVNYDKIVISVQGLKLVEMNSLRRLLCESTGLRINIKVFDFINYLQNLQGE